MSALMFNINEISVVFILPHIMVFVNSTTTKSSS